MRYYFGRARASWGLNCYPGNWNMCSESMLPEWTSSAIEESKIPDVWGAHRVPDTFVILFGLTLDKRPT